MNRLKIVKEETVLEKYTKIVKNKIFKRLIQEIFHCFKVLFSFFFFIQFYINSNYYSNYFFFFRIALACQIWFWDELTSEDMAEIRANKKELSEEGMRNCDVRRPVGK